MYIDKGKDLKKEKNEDYLSLILQFMKEIKVNFKRHLKKSRNSNKKIHTNIFLTGVFIQKGTF